MVICLSILLSLLSLVSPQVFSGFTAIEKTTFYSLLCLSWRMGWRWGRRDFPVALLKRAGDPGPGNLSEACGLYHCLGFEPWGPVSLMQRSQGLPSRFLVVGLGSGESLKNFGGDGQRGSRGWWPSIYHGRRSSLRWELKRTEPHTSFWAL
jgi:hypothetical protein